MTGGLRSVTEKDWIAKHSYLEPMAEFHRTVVSTANKCLPAYCCVPDWSTYVHDFQTGVPALRSSESIIDLQPLESIVPWLVEQLASAGLPGKLKAEIDGLARELAVVPKDSFSVIGFLLDADARPISNGGLLRYVGWTAARKYLSKLVEAFDKWRNEDLWLRSCCPLCGSRPAMAQLLGIDPGRVRLLWCGCCGTRWRFGRIQCPFCEDQDHRRIATLTFETEQGLRIDYCDSCKGYLKTYDGAGSEGLLLSDWTSVHLDVLAQDRGLKRLATSLYAL